MCHEQQSRRPIDGVCSQPSAIVERGNHRFARSSRSNAEMPISRLRVAFGLNLVENLLLKGVGPQVEEHNAAVVIGAAPALVA